MSNKNQLILGGIIGLKNEFEEQYIALNKHIFPGVLERIRLSNISDYSIFVHNGILFRNMVYSGTYYEADMKSMGTDKFIQEWWNLTDAMQQPSESGKDYEWWAGINLWYSYELPSLSGEKVIRHAYTVPAPSGLRDKVSDDYFGDIDLWGSAYDLRTLRIFKGVQDVYIYLETLKDSDHSFLLEIIARVLKTDAVPIAMREVFHCENQ